MEEDSELADYINNSIIIFTTTASSTTAISTYLLTYLTDSCCYDDDDGATQERSCLRAAAYTTKAQFNVIKSCTHFLPHGLCCLLSRELLNWASVGFMPGLSKLTSRRQGKKSLGFAAQDQPRAKKVMRRHQQQNLAHFCFVICVGLALRRVVVVGSIAIGLLVVDFIAAVESQALTCAPPWRISGASLRSGAQHAAHAHSTMVTPPGVVLIGKLAR